MEKEREIKKKRKERNMKCSRDKYTQLSKREKKRCTVRGEKREKNSCGNYGILLWIRRA